MVVQNSYSVSLWNIFLQILENIIEQEIRTLDFENQSLIDSA